MLELYHNINSVCAQKVRIALKEKGEEAYPAIGDWWSRVKERPSVKTAIFDRMQDADWAPFKNLAPDPWPKVQQMLQAA